MGKQNKGKQVAQGTGSTQGAQVAGTVQGNQAVNPQVIAKVKAGVVYRGARAAWYKALVEHEGKPVKEFYEATAKTPPSLPKSGTAELPSGWLRFFVRGGIATLSE
jgi:hypothetical protein